MYREEKLFSHDAWHLQKKFFFVNVIEVCYVGDPGATAFLSAGKVDFPGQFCTHYSIYLQASKAF